MTAKTPLAVLFTEDPGSANFVAELPGALATRGIEGRLLAFGPAEGYLERRIGRDFEVANGLDAAAILDHFQPQLVVVGTSENPQTPGLALVAECASRQIPTVGVVDSPASSTHRFRGTTDDPLAFAPDTLLVPELLTRSHYVDLGYPADRVLACGHPHYDFVRDFGERNRSTTGQLRKKLYPGASPEQRVLVFAADLSSGLDPADYRWSPGYSLRGRGESTGRTEIVLEEFLDALAPYRSLTHCVLRLHPKSAPDEFAPYRDAFDQVSRDEPALEVVLAADGAVGMTTMFLLEAVLLGTPTLSIVPRELERGWMATTHYGITPCATTREQVRAEVSRLVFSPQLPDEQKVREVLPAGSLARAAAAIAGVLA